MPANAATSPLVFPLSPLTSGHQPALAQRARQLVVGRGGENLPGHVHGGLALLAAVLLAHPLGCALVLVDVNILVLNPEPVEELARVLRVLAPIRAVDFDSEHGRRPPLRKVRPHHNTRPAARSSSQGVQCSFSNPSGPK